MATFRCRKCPETYFSSLLMAVKHANSDRKTPFNLVQCPVQGCLYATKRRIRLHIRKRHANLCPVSCPNCKEKFVEEKDQKNHSSAVHHVSGVPVSSAPMDYFERKTHISFTNINFDSERAVNDFIACNLQLDDYCKSRISDAIDNICRHLQSDLGEYGVHNLVKGGSVGKGTAVRGKADIDCVVFLNKFKTMQDHKRNLKKTKDLLESSLKRSPFKVTIDKQTPFAVKFKLSTPGDSSQHFDVDLLPTFNNDCTSEQLYMEMLDCSDEDKRYYSAALVKLQVEFVKSKPAKVKDLIRLVKYWRKTCIEDEEGGPRLPTSYPLELITIYCWERAKSQNSFDTRVGFKAVLQQLVDYNKIGFMWCKNYSEELARKGINKMNNQSRYSRPFILDPANPTNNVCSAADSDGWRTVADVAKRTLDQAALRSLDISHNWQ